MKTIKYISIFFILLIAGNVSAQQISSAELLVTGLTCSMCSQATEKSLKSLDFVEGIRPDLNKNTFVISFKKNRTVNIDLIRKKVQDAGFSIGNMTAVFNFDNLKLDNNGQAVEGPAVYRFLNAKDKTLNGEVKVNVVDRNFIPGSAFKQKSAQFKAETYASGYGVVNGKKTRV
ncbi:MAG TPA: cation transporter, partial [Pedobacter sp.]|nr:cation transporter [Pedobacter sp.]